MIIDWTVMIRTIIFCRVNVQNNQVQMEIYPTLRFLLNRARIVLFERWWRTYLQRNDGVDCILIKIDRLL